jgi:hypothetical protein
MLLAPYFLFFPNSSHVVSHLDIEATRTSSFSQGDVSRLIGVSRKRRRPVEGAEHQLFRPEKKARHGNRLPALVEKVRSTLKTPH